MTSFFIVEKAKQKLLFENCKFFLRKKYCLFLLEGFPHSSGCYGLGFLSVDFDSF